MDNTVIHISVLSECSTVDVLGFKANNQTEYWIQKEEFESKLAVQIWITQSQDYINRNERSQRPLEDEEEEEQPYDYEMLKNIVNRRKEGTEAEYVVEEIRGEVRHNTVK